MASSTIVINIKPGTVADIVRAVSAVVGEQIAVPATNDIVHFVRLIMTHGDKFIESAPDSDVEGVFQVLFQYVQSNNPLFADHVAQLTQLLSSNVEIKPSLRLRTLASLYNTISSSNTGDASSSMYVSVLLAIINYASKTSQLSYLQGYIDMLDGLVEKWGLSKDDQRTLFLDVSNALEADGQGEKAQKFLLKYLVTFDAGEIPEDVEIVSKAVVGAIRNPIVSFMERHNLLGLSAVATLQNDQKYMKLYELLRIFTEGKLSEYLVFHESNSDVLASNNISHEECVTNMRLLSMCSLATEHEEIPYNEISKSLDVPLDDVEEWVVKTITSKLIDAKMDQLQQRVVISRCTHRQFDRAQWEQLQEKLLQWQANLRGVLDTLQRTRAHQNAAAASM